MSQEACGLVELFWEVCDGDGAAADSRRTPPPVGTLTPGPLPFPVPAHFRLTGPPFFSPSTPLHSKEASVFDERKEAEMRLYSEALARELALKKERAEAEENDTTPDPETAPAQD